MCIKEHKIRNYFKIKLIELNIFITNQEFCLNELFNQLKKLEKKEKNNCKKHRKNKITI